MTSSADFQNSREANQRKNKTVPKNPWYESKLLNQMKLKCPI